MVFISFIGEYIGSSGKFSVLIYDFFKKKELGLFKKKLLISCLTVSKEVKTGPSIEFWRVKNEI